MLYEAVRKDLFNNGTQTAVEFLSKLKNSVQELNESSL